MNEDEIIIRQTVFQCVLDTLSITFKSRIALIYIYLFYLRLFTDSIIIIINI